MTKLTKTVLKGWVNYLDGRGLVITDDNMINKEIEALREDNITVDDVLLSSLEECANQLSMFLELHEDDEDAPEILERAEKLIKQGRGEKPITPQPKG